MGMKTWLNEKIVLKGVGVSSDTFNACNPFTHSQGVTHFNANRITTLYTRGVFQKFFIPYYFIQEN